MPVEADHVFVYGTLRKGESLHHHVERAALTFISQGKIRGRLYDMGEYPGAVGSDNEKDEVQGELYRITRPAEQLRELDEVEEYDPARPEGSLFVRRVAEVTLPDGASVLAWAYFLPREPGKRARIRGGDYGRHRRARGAG